jgi:hypothetical protein
MYSKLLVLFLMVILVASVASSTIPASAMLIQRDYTYLNDNHLTARYGNTIVCGDHICAPGEWDQLQAKLLAAQLGYQGGRNIAQTTMPTAPAAHAPIVPPPVTITVNKTAPTTANNIAPTMPAPSATTPAPMPTMTTTWTTKTGTVTSVQDPGIGHESHQLAIILPPDNGNIYQGVISWTSSKPLQIVELSGPLAQGDDKGQPIWTVDLKTKYALTLVNANETTGSFEFTGNALALHFSQPIPFTATYAVSYTESSPSDTVTSGTLTSIQDPGQGHQTHQLAIILPPSAKPYHGILTYSASEPVQLVTLIPINGTDNNGQLVYTIDGKTWYGLVFVDYYNTAMGTCSFAGNALAVHTVHITPFQVSYTVTAHQ